MSSLDCPPESPLLSLDTGIWRSAFSPCPSITDSRAGSTSIARARSKGVMGEWLRVKSLMGIFLHTPEVKGPGSCSPRQPGDRRGCRMEWLPVHGETPRLGSGKNS